MMGGGGGPGTVGFSPTGREKWTSWTKGGGSVTIYSECIYNFVDSWMSFWSVWSASWATVIFLRRVWRKGVDQSALSHNHEMHVDIHLYFPPHFQIIFRAFHSLPYLARPNEIMHIFHHGGQMCCQVKLSRACLIL